MFLIDRSESVVKNMNIKKLNQWLMLVANLGVLGGILFLAYEVRQNTSQMRTQASQAITEMVNAMNTDEYSDPNLTDLIMRGNQDGGAPKL